MEKIMVHNMQLFFFSTFALKLLPTKIILFNL